jgi:hypothetical protein
MSTCSSLATDVSIIARSKKQAMPMHQLPAYPVVNKCITNASHKHHEAAWKRWLGNLGGQIICYCKIGAKSACNPLAGLNTLIFEYW